MAFSGWQAGLGGLVPRADACMDNTQPPDVVEIKSICFMGLFER